MSGTTRRDPTLALVLVLVLVVGGLLLARSLGGSSQESAVDDSPGDVGPTPSPVATPTASPVPTPDTPGNGKGGKAGKDGKGRGGGGDGGPRSTGGEVCIPTDEDVDLSVVSYNIKSGHLGGGLPALAGYLRSIDADIVLLQEVDQLRYASGRIDQPAFFGAQLDMPYAFGKNVPHAGGGAYGTLVLSRFPLVSSSNTFLPQPPGTQRRGLLHVVVDVDGTEVSVYNTHLQNADPNARILQANAIRSLVADDPRPRILGGDLNAPPGSPPIDILAGAWTDTWTQVGLGPGRTAPAGGPRARIDYLLYGGPGLAPLATDVLPARISDHLAVRALYRLAADGEAVCLPELG